MDRNQIIGLVLMGLLVVAFFFSSRDNVQDVASDNSQIEQQSEEETPSVEESTPSIIEPEPISDLAINELDSAQRVLLEEQVLSKYGVFAPSGYGTESEFKLENDFLHTTLSNKGGMFKTAEVQTYQVYNSEENISLWNPETAKMDLSFEYLNKGEMNTSNFYFEKVSGRETATIDQPAYLKLRLNTNDPSKYIEYSYTLPYDSYTIDFSMNLVGLDDIVNTTSENMDLNWEIEGFTNEKSTKYERQSSSVFFREMGEGRDYLREATEQEETLEGKLNWFAFKQKFFSAIVISNDGFENGAYLSSKPPVSETDSVINMMYAAKAPLSSGSSTSLTFFLGPNDYKELQALEVEEITRVIDYGPWIIGWVNRNIVRPIFFFFSKYIGNAGIVILIITILIKMVLFPVTWKNYLSSAKMRVLKPEIEEISEKFKGKEKAVEKQQATMALYRKTGVNPFAGCIPVLLQMPILYAMFRFFPASIEVRGKSFLWADDLSAYDTLVNIPEIPFYGAHISGFTVLMAISTFIYTRMNSANMAQPTQPGMPNMKVIMNIFPLFMLFIFNSFAAGLSLYYFVANMISIAQMWSIKKYFINEDKIRAKIDSNKKKPKKKSSFQQRLEEMQKQQQSKLKQQKKK